MESTASPTQPDHGRGGAIGAVEPHAAVAEALRQIADAVRDAARQASPDPLALMRAEQVAELLNLPARTVRDQAAASVIPHRRFGNTTGSTVRMLKRSCCRWREHRGQHGPRSAPPDSLPESKGWTGNAPAV